MASPIQRTRPLYASAIARCEAAGVKLTADEYADIYEAAVRCIEGDGTGAVPALLDIPVQVGPVTLWPRTLGAALWWDRYGKKWYGGKDPADEVVALAWMLSRPKDSALFRRLTCKAAADVCIVAWQVGLASSVTLEALAWGIQRLFGRIDVDAASGAKIEAASEVDWGEVVAQLCATYHRKPEYFLWEIGEAAALELLKKAPPPPGCKRAGDDAQGRFADFAALVSRIIASKAGAQ